MKRIGNFLFVEQWFKDATPRQAIVSINAITCICAENVCNHEYTVIELTNDTKIALTGEHVDNIVDLSKLLNQ